MKTLHSKHEVTSDSVRYIDETTGCPELGPWEVAKRMQGDIVETSGKEGRQDLASSVEKFLVPQDSYCKNYQESVFQEL
jgi:hypothetical protein